MKHLSNEFSMELLLSLVEFIQFKQFIDKKLEKQKNTKDEISKLLLASCIPKSTIVYNKNDNLKEKALKLYNKYIRVSSEWEINVSSGLRKQLQNRFENNYNNNNNDNNHGLFEWNDDELYTVFDQCNDEMLKLLGYSLSRFRQKPFYAGKYFWNCFCISVKSVWCFAFLHNVCFQMILEISSNTF